jgi:hypothetical protein
MDTSVRPKQVMYWPSFEIRKRRGYFLQVMAFWFVMLYNVVVGYQCFWGPLVSKHHATWCNNPENHDLYLHRHENLKSRIRVCFTEDCTLFLYLTNWNKRKGFVSGVCFSLNALYHQEQWTIFHKLMKEVILKQTYMKLCSWPCHFAKTSNKVTTYEYIEEKII